VIATIGIGAFVLLFLGVPIWMIFVLMAGVGIQMSGVSMEIVVQGLSGSINKLVLLSIPGFIFAGGIMGKGGMSTRLIAWLSALIGRIPGGLPLTTVAGAEVFGAISGSSAATVAALGKILYPALLKEGYGERFSLGLITSSGAIAMIIPPSITMILFAVMTNASVGKLFLAGVIPGLVVGACVGAYCLWYALRHRITSGRTWQWSEIVRTTREVSWTLGAPLLIFGGIYGGFMTPTEASMAVSVYAVVVCVYIYREMTWKDVWEITRETSLLTAKILIIMAAASVFSWVLTAEQVPQNIKLWIDAMDLSPLQVIWMINIILLIIGMLIDPNSAILLFTPLLWPIAEHAGLDLIHFGIIFTVNLAIGMFTPPFGLNIFVSVSIFRENTAKIVMGLIPFFIAYLVALGLITYFPALSLTLPNLLMK
jgi:C4-dicarboxylate transporter DctM subunit